MYPLYAVNAWMKKTFCYFIDIYFFGGVRAVRRIFMSSV